MVEEIGGELKTPSPTEPAAGADLTTTTLLDTRNQLDGWFPVLAQEQHQRAAS